MLGSTGLARRARLLVQFAEASDCEDTELRVGKHGTHGEVRKAGA